MTEVRRATDADVEAVVTTVTAAFADDPAWTFMLGDADARSWAGFARALLLPRLAAGTAWVADDGEAVAMWDRRPEDTGAAHDEAAFDQLRVEVGEQVWARMSAYEDALDALAPPRPYWYLGVLATRPDAQGRGLASAVMEPGFAAAAGDGWDCWLETSTSQNKAFYARRGFTHDVPVDVPGGPTTWWLRRR